MGGSELAFAFHHRSTLCMFLASPRFGEFAEFVDCPGFPNSKKKTSGGEFTHRWNAPTSGHPAQDC